MSSPPPINPYASPAIAEPLQLPQGDAGLPLFSLTAVTVATFFGSFAAGVVIMAINYARTGRAAAFRWTLGIGLSASVLLFIVLCLLPDEVPSVIPLLGQMVAAHLLAT